MNCVVCSEKAAQEGRTGRINKGNFDSAKGKVCGHHRDKNPLLENVFNAGFILKQGLINVINNPPDENKFEYCLSCWDIHTTDFCNIQTNDKIKLNSKTMIEAWEEAHQHGLLSQNEIASVFKSSRDIASKHLDYGFRESLDIPWGDNHQPGWVSHRLQVLTYFWKNLSLDPGEIDDNIAQLVKVV